MSSPKTHRWIDEHEPSHKVLQEINRLEKSSPNFPDRLASILLCSLNHTLMLGLVHRSIIYCPRCERCTLLPSPQLGQPGVRRVSLTNNKRDAFNAKAGRHVHWNECCRELSSTHPINLRFSRRPDLLLMDYGAGIEIDETPSRVWKSPMARRHSGKSPRGTCSFTEGRRLKKIITKQA